MSTRITVDPVTRIEGHLRIDADHIGAEGTHHPADFRADATHADNRDRAVRQMQDIFVGKVTHPFMPHSRCQR